MDQLTSQEQFYFLLIAGVLLVLLIRNFFHHDSMRFWSPLTIMAIIFIYYVVIGPLISIQTGLTYLRLVDHRAHYESAWFGAFVALAAMLFGYAINSNRPRLLSVSPDPSLLRKASVALFAMGILGLTVTVGTGGLVEKIDFTSIAGRSEGYQGAFSNYFLYMMNFFIPACCLGLIAALKGRMKWWVLLIMIGLSTAIYTNEGFRYRISLLFLALAITYYFASQKRISVPLMGLATFFGIVLMGLIQLSRNYTAGLNLAKIEGRSQYELFMQGFGEAATFQTTGLLIDRVPQDFNHIGMAPIFQTIVFPIPRVLWPDKPSGDYLQIVMDLYGGVHGQGAAVLSFGEYYLAFGTIGIFAGYFLIGYYYRHLWKWVLANRYNPLAIVCYACAVSYMYMVISRGYLPQVVMLFFFTVLPAWGVVWYFRRKKLRYGERLEWNYESENHTR